MVTKRSRTIRILVLLSLFIGNLNGGPVSILFANDASAARAGAELGNDLSKSERTRPAANGSREVRLAETYGKLPMSFEANEGQFDSRVRFASRGRGYALFLTANEAVISLSRPAGNDSSSDHPERQSASSSQPFNAPAAIEGRTPPSESAGRLEPRQSTRPRSILRMKLIGGRRSPRAERMNELAGKSNYFIGNDPKRWRTNVSTFAKVRYRSVYRGIDLVYRGDHGSLEYDFNIAPGANPRAIRLCFDGAARVRIDETGDLVLSTLGGEVRQHKPIVYQEINGTRRVIAARYSRNGKNRVGFEVGRYDAGKALVIDPVLSYSTYLGGGSDDAGRSIAVDASGNACVTGFTVSSDFPLAAPLQPLPGDSGDAYITKLNATGTALIYSTYLGGNGSDFGNGIAVDLAGNAYVTGTTFSTDFPMANAIQPSKGGSLDGFVTKLNSMGSALVYSTYLGGNAIDEGHSIAADTDGSAYVTGRTLSTNFPTANPLQPSSSGGNDIFVSKLNSQGTAFVYSTYLGGVGSEIVAAIAVDSSGNAYVAGSTTSPNFPIVNALQPVFTGKTVFKTLDGAGSWSAINNGLSPHFGITAIAVNPLTPSTLYAGTSLRELFKSTDAGGSWNAVNMGLQVPPGIINAIAFNPVTPTTLFVAANNGLFRSTDGGQSWNASPLLNVFSLAIDPVNTSNVYAGLRNIIAKSTDGGTSFTQITVRDNAEFAGDIHALVIDPASPSTIYVGGSALVFKSTDGGTNWSIKSLGLLHQPVPALVIDPVTPSTLYAAQSISVRKTTNGGDNWVAAGAVLSSNVQSLVIDPAATSTIYAGTSSRGVFKSTDGGGAWAQMRNGMANSFVAALAIDPVNTATIYSGNGAVNDGFVLKLNQNASALVYSTYLGGDDADYCSDIAVDASGNAYVTGLTTSTDFPTVNPLQSHFADSTDSFVAKLNNAGSALVYSTYLGGSNTDSASGIAVDAGGNAFVIGSTDSPDFPVVAALQSSLGDQAGDAFITKLNGTGTALLYSTYFGGASSDQFTNDQDIGNAITVDSAGDAYVTGETFSLTFPITKEAFQKQMSGSPDGFIAKLSASPSAVKLSSFKATGYDEGVYLKWETGFEGDNLGFNVYREVAGRRELVNPDLVAGSALKAGAGTKLQAGQSYSWWDKGIADCGSRNADCWDAQYWLEEIDLNGTRTMHGPFGVVRAGGEPSRESRADLLSSLGRSEARTAQMPLVYPGVHSKSSEAKQLATSLASESPKAFAPGLSPALKMTIKEEGWYRVTQQELVAAGLDAKSDPRRLQLFVEGAEQAILVRGEQDGSLDAGDAIEFFATGQDNAFTDAHVYWLVSGEGYGKRIRAVKSKGKTGGLRSFPYTAERRDRTIYFSSLRNGEAENFFGAVIGTQRVDQRVMIRHVDMRSGEPAEVEIALQGVTELGGKGPDHQVSVRLNGTEIGKMVFDGQANKVEKFAVKPGVLVEGENVISLESERGNNDVSLVDHVRVTYGHRYESDENSLRMTAAAGASETITGFTTPSIRILDITNPAQVGEFLGTIRKQEDGYAVTVNVGGQGTRTLLALTEDRVKRPAGMTLDRASTWRSESNEADLLIISRREFFSMLEGLKRLRESQGIRVALVDIEDVYDEFSYGERTPQALKEMILWASTRWRGKPAFVLLGGDASVDPRNYLGFGDKDVVPTKLVDTALMETASDEWFGDKDGDGVGEVAVGRLPFRTGEEAATMVSKILSYERGAASTEALLVSDRNDEFDFERASGQIGEEMPTTVKVSELQRGRVDAAKAKLEFMEAMKRGQKLVNYVGHGSANKWNGDLLTNEEARGLKNGDRLPVFVMMTCLNGYFADAAGESLGESLMKSELGGAVAVWASTGVTSPNGQVAIDREFYRLLFSRSEEVTIGEAAKLAKRAASDPDIRRTWVLLGDPTMRLK